MLPQPRDELVVARLRRDGPIHQADPERPRLAGAQIRLQEGGPLRRDPFRKTRLRGPPQARQQLRADFQRLVLRYLHEENEKQKTKTHSAEYKTRCAEGESPDPGLRCTRPNPRSLRPAILRRPTNGASRASTNTFPPVTKKT